MRSFTWSRQRVIVVLSILTFLFSDSEEVNDNPVSTISSTDVITRQDNQTDDVTPSTLPVDKVHSTSSMKSGHNILRDSSEKVRETNEDENCTNSQGWNLKGSDWGCCGNYLGCCTYASFVCYIHDALCRCCDVRGNFCGPKCKPESECNAKNDTNDGSSVSYENFWSNNKNNEEENRKYDVMTTSSYNSDMIEGSGETVFHAGGPD